MRSTCNDLVFADRGEANENSIQEPNINKNKIFLKPTYEILSYT